MRRGSFEIFDHPSDIGIRVYGSTLEECFQNAAYGMFSLIAPGFAPALSERRDVRVAAGDLEGLLVAWLSELLYLFDAEAFFPSEIEIKGFSGRELRADVAGDIVQDRPRRCELEIKAVTYHLLKVEEVASPEPGGGRAWRAEVVFDV